MLGAAWQVLGWAGCMSCELHAVCLLAYLRHRCAAHPMPAVPQMYCGTLPLFYDLVVSSEEGAEGAPNEGVLPRWLSLLQLPCCWPGTCTECLRAPPSYAHS